MTTPHDFDRNLVDWLDEAAAPQVPDYFDELLDRTRQTRQRPAWASLERWLPMQLSIPRPIAARPRAAWLLVVLAIVVALVLLAVGLGARHRLPSPFGPAANGLIAADDNYQIALRDADGTNLHLLTPNTEVDSVPSWSPDGTRLAFYSWPVRTAVDASVGAGPPIYDSPDKPIGSLVVMDADGTGRRVLAHDVLFATGLVVPAAWSHDGTRIAYSYRGTDNIAAIDVVTLDGTRTFHLVMGDTPSWSPDDTRLAYRVDSVGVFAVSLVGGQPVRVSRTAGQGFGFAGATWSPDGKRLAYYAGTDGAHDVYIANADGSGELPVATTPADEYWPAWSPDGSRFAFERVEDANNDIRYVVASGDGANQRELATPILAGVPNAWSPDGRYLVGHTITPDATKMTGLMLVDVLDPHASITIPSLATSFAWQRIAP